MKKILPNRTADGEIACAFHEKWEGPHPLCAAEVERVCGLPAGSVEVPDFSTGEPESEKYATVKQASLFDLEETDAEEEVAAS